MLMKTYTVDEDGRWRRQLDDFIEDVVVVCPMCGNEPAGHFEADGGTFAFVPANSSGKNMDSELNSGRVPQ